MRVGLEPLVAPALPLFPHTQHSRTFHRHLDPTAPNRLRKKGAGSTAGQLVQAVMLTEEEEDALGTDVLMTLAGTGIILN